MSGVKPRLLECAETSDDRGTTVAIVKSGLPENLTGSIDTGELD